MLLDIAKDSLRIQGGDSISPKRRASKGKARQKSTATKLSERRINPKLAAINEHVVCLT